jgi:hypothetical protein
LISMWLIEILIGKSAEESNRPVLKSFGGRNDAH